MVLFSERQNIVPKKEILLNDIRDDTRVSLWNAFYKIYSQHEGLHTPEHPYQEIWCDFFRLTVDKMPTFTEFYLKYLKEIYFFYRIDHESGWKWFTVFDFLDFVSQNDTNLKRKIQFQNDCNSILERDLSGYRFVENVITPIISEHEINEIEQAIQTSPDTVKQHIQKALILFSDRQSPDFPNSIKESISAVEAQCKIICDEPTPTLTKSLDIIQQRGHVKIHPHLIEAFKKIYSWTNDDGGIRHGLTNEQIIYQEDAQFMLITCSAFINYLLIKNKKTTS